MKPAPLFAALLRDGSGNTALEFALAAPVIMMVILAMAEFGLLLWTQSSLHFAVEQASRCATVDTSLCNSAAAVQNYAASQAYGLTIAPGVFTYTAATCGNQVSASYRYDFVVTGLFLNSLTLTAQSCFPK